MVNFGVVGLAAWVAAAPAVAQAPAKPEKLDIVATVGCLKESSPDHWMLEQATEPVPSNANAPPAKEIASMPKSGRNQFQLIGVGVFNLPSHRGHTVLIKGLHIKATPMSRLNVTSVTMVAPACEPPAK